MQHALKFMTRARLTVLGVVALLIALEQGLAGDPRPTEMSSSNEAEASLVEPVDPATLQVQPRAVVPRYYYGWGYQGYGYYPAPVQQVAPPVQQVAPPVQQVAPPVQQVAPPIQQVAPPIQQFAPAPAAAPRPSTSARSHVGPGVRNWSTGHSSPLHRPWMKPM